MKNKSVVLYAFFSGFINFGLAEAATPIEVKWQAYFSPTLQFLAHSRTNNVNIGGGVQDALLHAELRHDAISPVQAVIGLGVLEKFQYEGALAPFSPVDIGLQYGWVNYQVTPQWHWELGQLINPAGIESAISAKNDYIQLGSINRSRAFYYPGLRTVYQDGGFKFFVELNGPDSPNNTGGTFSAQLDYGSGKVAANFTRYVESGDLYSDLSWKQKIANLQIGAVVDYFLLDETAFWQDDRALAFAGYLKLQLDRSYLALRGEYFDMGTSGILFYDKAGAITATYGVDITPWTYGRFEVVYVKSNRYVFRDDITPVDYQWGIATQIGMCFGD